MARRVGRQRRRRSAYHCAHVENKSRGGHRRRAVSKKNCAAKAICTVRADRPDAAPTDRVVGLGSLQIQRRFTAAARAAGIEARLTAHSGRVGLASELTARGASTTEVMLAGNWKTARMVAHYSAGATAERGAVAKYL